MLDTNFTSKLIGKFQKKKFSLQSRIPTYIFIKYIWFLCLNNII